MRHGVSPRPHLDFLLLKIIRTGTTTRAMNMESTMMQKKTASNAPLYWWEILVTDALMRLMARVNSWENLECSTNQSLLMACGLCLFLHLLQPPSIQTGYISRPDLMT